MRHDVFVYLAGPMTARDGLSIEINVAAAVGIYLDCLRRGVPAFCPHLSGAFPTAWSALTWDHWLAYDEAVIDRCTHMLRLPRWERSPGACREIAYAETHGIPVIDSLDELPEPQP